MDNSDLPDDVGLRLLRTWSVDAAVHALALAEVDPSWGSAVHPVADGNLILAGRSMYVNRAMGVGITQALSDANIVKIQTLSSAAQVPTAIEVSAESHPSVTSSLKQAGFVHNTASDYSALAMPLSPPPASARAKNAVSIRGVANHAELLLWQEAAALGWGHVDPTARQVSDAFAAAAYRVEPSGMMLAYDSSQSAVVGCATVTVRNGLATLGGMSTVPEFRRQGVQATMIAERISYAIGQGCDLAATTALSGGPSERNLLRHGFSKVLTIETWTTEEI